MAYESNDDTPSLPQPFHGPPTPFQKFARGEAAVALLLAQQRLCAEQDPHAAKDKRSPHEKRSVMDAVR
jgi:hypothetical protein